MQGTRTRSTTTERRRRVRGIPKEAYNIQNTLPWVERGVCWPYLQTDWIYIPHHIPQRSNIPPYCGDDGSREEERLAEVPVWNLG